MARLAQVDCERLTSKIRDLEDSLDDYLTGQRAASVGSGSEQASFFAGADVPNQIRKRITDLQSQYRAGGCAVTLGAAAPGGMRRRALKLDPGYHG